MSPRSRGAALREVVARDERAETWSEPTTSVGAIVHLDAVRLPGDFCALETPPASAPSGRDPLLHEILTVPELAGLLRLKTKSVYALLSRDPKAIPGCRKVGGAWRAHRVTVLAWLAGQVSDARQQQRGVR